MSCNVITTEDSNFIFVNYLQDSATGRQDAGFITIDKQGNEILQNSFNYFNQSWLTFINRKHFVQVSKHSFFLAGADPNSNVLIAKINNISLDTLKTVRFQIPGYSFNLNSFVKVNANRFFLIGESGNSSGSYATFCIDLDSSLSIVNHYTLTNISNNWSCKSAILNPLNSEILLHGTSNNFDNPNTFYSIDTNFASSNQSVSVNSQTRTINQVFFSKPDTTIVCLGYYRTGVSSGWPIVKICISKYTTDFKLLWQKTYGKANIFNAVSNAVILNDGSIITCGKYAESSNPSLTNSDYNGVILKVNKDGNFRWMREYSHYGTGNSYEGFYGLDRALDGGFILCGSVQNLPHAKAWAVKTDSTGCVTPGCASSTVTVDSLIIPKDTSIAVGINKWVSDDSEFHVYPNPAKDEFTIDFISDETFLLVLSDVQGRELKRINFKRQDKISTDELSSGVFLMRIYRNNALKSVQKIVVID